MSARLAPWATTAANTRGRRVREASPAWRDEFQRDRDRVVHSSAFRRLEYKTQVFVNHEGDMFRTRLTHSLEVAQIARAVARALGANEDLTEAIALAHDLGHTPFGHAGQSALDRCMRERGGFEHNLHSLRVVDVLEQRYPDFDGLNLLFETREGILKHCRPATAATLGDVGRRFIDGRQPGVEAQIANVADEIAYNHHDIDDGLRSGILSLNDVREHDDFEAAFVAQRRRFSSDDDRRLVHSVIRHMLGGFVNDLITHSHAQLAAACASADDVRRAAAPLVRFSDNTGAAHLALKRMLHRRLYRDGRVRALADSAAATVRDLFACYMDAPEEMESLPADDGDETALARRVADYIAGMTDRFAIAEHHRLCGDSHFDAPAPPPLRLVTGRG